MSAAARARATLWFAVAVAAMPAAAAGPGAGTPRAAASSAQAASAPASAPAVPPVEFAGTLEAGSAYAGELVYDPNALRTWRPVKDVVVPRDSSWTIQWKNLDQFPVLKTAAARAKPQRVVFRVLSADIQSGSPKQPWTITYQGELVSVESAAPASKAPARRR